MNRLGLTAPCRDGLLSLLHLLIQSIRAASFWPVALVLIVDDLRTGKQVS